jgi:hypothetical protein
MIISTPARKPSVDARGAGTARIPRAPRPSRHPAGRRATRSVLCALCDSPILPPDEPYASPFGPICILCVEDVAPDDDLPEDAARW